MKLMHIVGARPNFMKLAPLWKAVRSEPSFQQIIVHTGQHYDEQMSGAFFRDLHLPEPDVNLGVGSGSHSVQTADVMKAFEPVLLQNRPDMLVVFGDVNSTLACTLVAAKLHVPVAHVEAGLRSYDRSMPEEINRLVTDRLADLLLTPSRGADANLRSEGVPEDRIRFVGNIMIDSVLAQREDARRLQMPKQLGVEPGSYILATLHRPSNVDDPAQLREILLALQDLAQRWPVLFPMHPRTRKNIDHFGLGELLKPLRVSEPLGYRELLGLLESAKLVVTDSGGVQEETTALGVPCLTLRDSTERPVTVEQGTNTLVPNRTRTAITEAVPTALGKQGSVPEGWDGNTAGRIVEAFSSWNASQAACPAVDAVLPRSL